MIIRVSKNKENPYTLINNFCLKDPSISAKAKGIFAYVMSLPDDWKFYASELKNHFRDGIESISSGLKELEVKGYLERNKVKNEKSQFMGWEYHFFEEPKKSVKVQPKREKPKPENPFSVFPKTGNPQLQSIDSDKILIKQKTKKKEEEAATPPVAAVALKDETKAVVPGGSFTPAIKTEIDFAWSAMKELKVLPDAKGGRDSLFHAMRMIATRPRYNGHAVEILKQANEYFGRIIKMATNDGGFPLTESRRKGWLIGTFEGAIEASIRYTPKEVIPAIQWALQDPWWKSRFNGFDHLPAVILQYREGVASGKIK